MKRLFAALAIVLLIAFPALADQPGIPTALPQQTCAVTAAGTSCSFIINGAAWQSAGYPPVRGFLNYWVIAIPNWTNAGTTTTMSVKDMFGNAIWTDPTARAQNATYVFLGTEGGVSAPLIPIDGPTTITFTLNQAPGSGGGTITWTGHIR
jgi:hypothetical protein